jgi:hypothetical protein
MDTGVPPGLMTTSETLSALGPLVTIGGALGADSAAAATAEGNRTNAE